MERREKPWRPRREWYEYERLPNPSQPFSPGESEHQVEHDLPNGEETDETNGTGDSDYTALWRRLRDYQLKWYAGLTAESTPGTAPTPAPASEALVWYEDGGDGEPSTINAFISNAGLWKNKPNSYLSHTPPLSSGVPNPIQYTGHFTAPPAGSGTDNPLRDSLAKMGVDAIPASITDRRLEVAAKELHLLVVGLVQSAGMEAQYGQTEMWDVIPKWKRDQYVELLKLALGTALNQRLFHS